MDGKKSGSQMDTTYEQLHYLPMELHISALIALYQKVSRLKQFFKQLRIFNTSITHQLHIAITSGSLYTDDEFTRKRSWTISSTQQCMPIQTKTY